MNRRLISLVLVSALLAWASGWLLDVHLHHVGPDHDSHHCEQCLSLVASSPAVIDPGVQFVLYEPSRWSAVAEPLTVIAARCAHTAFASRAPPML